MVSVEIRYSDFQNVSHQKQLGRASGADQVIYEAACSLFDELWNGKPIRLLGVRTAKLVDEDEPEQLSLFDLQFEVKSEKPKKSMEKLKKLSAAMGRDPRKVWGGCGDTGQCSGAERKREEI